MLRALAGAGRRPVLAPLLMLNRAALAVRFNGRPYSSVPDVGGLASLSIGELLAVLRILRPDRTVLLAQCGHLRLAGGAQARE